MFRAVLILVAALHGAASHAHPGHQSAGLGSWLHLLTEPDHLAMLALPVAICAWLGARRWRRRQGAPRPPAKLR